MRCVASLRGPMQKKDPEFRIMFARDTRAVWIERSGTGKEGTISSRLLLCTPEQNRPEVPGGISLPEGLLLIVEPKYEGELTATDDVDTT